MRADLRGTLVVASLYALANALIRLVGGTRLAMDDAKTNLFTQAWRWGYQADNPPLYEWLIGSLHLVTGGGLASFLVLNAACLVVAATCMHLTVRRIADERTAFGTAVGMVLLYQVGWNYHQAFTHSALLLAMVCAGTWAFGRLVRAPRPSAYVLFGLVLGLGFLSKYNFALLAVGLLAAGASLRTTRPAVLSPWMLLGLAMAAGIAAPHAVWLVGRADAYAASLPETLGTEAGRLAGLASLAVAVVSFFLPWAIVYGWLRLRAVPPPVAKRRPSLWSASGGTGGPDPAPDLIRGDPSGVRDGAGSALRSDHRTTPLAIGDGGPPASGGTVALRFDGLLLRAAAFSLALILLGILAFGVGAVSERYVIPVLLPAYVALTARLLAARPAALRPYVLSCLAFALLFSGVRLAGFLRPGPPFCDACRAFVPYEALTDALADAVPQDAILLAREENTAGNLVAAFPQARVTSANLLTQFNPAAPADAARPCYYVWSEDMVGGVPLHPVFSFAYDDPRTVLVDARWPGRLGRAGRRTAWGITPLEGPLYARFCASDAPG